MARSMSDLRTRIAAALKKQAEFRVVYKIADFDYRFLADAVIRELEPELNRHDTGCVCDRCWFGTASGMSFEGEAEDE